MSRVIIKIHLIIIFHLFHNLHKISFFALLTRLINRLLSNFPLFLHFFLLFPLRNSSFLFFLFLFCFQSFLFTPNFNSLYKILKRSLKNTHSRCIKITKTNRFHYLRLMLINKLYSSLYHQNSTFIFRKPKNSTWYCWNTYRRCLVLFSCYKRVYSSWKQLLRVTLFSSVDWTYCMNYKLVPHPTRTCDSHCSCFDPSVFFDVVSALMVEFWSTCSWYCTSHPAAVEKRLVGCVYDCFAGLSDDISLNYLKDHSFVCCLCDYLSSHCSVISYHLFEGFRSENKFWIFIWNWF